MAKNHETHDRAHPSLAEGREPMDTKRTEDGGGVRPGKGGGKGGGIYEPETPSNRHSELQGEHGGGKVGIKQKFERKGEHFSQPEGPAGAANMTEAHHDGSTAKAEHHKSPSHEACCFPQAKGAHGYGHDATQRRGHFRLSGSKGAHQIGKRKK